MEIPPDLRRAFEEGTPGVLPIEGMNGMDVGLDESGEALAIRILVSDPANPPPDMPQEMGALRCS